MDKDHRQISIRLNGKKHNYEESAEPEAAAANEEDELLSLPEPEKKTSKIIDFGKRLHERKKNDQPFWDDGNREQGPKLPLKRKKKRRTTIGLSLKSLPMSMIIAVVSAVIIGISFGFMVLTVFTSDRIEPTTAPSMETNEPLGTPVITEGEVTIPALTVDIVQGGAFSTADKGEVGVANLQRSGYAAVISKANEPVLLFIGVGNNREEAAAVADLYKENGQEVYLKSLTIPTVQMPATETSSATFLAEGGELFHELITLSVNSLNSSSPTEKQLTAIEQKHVQWKEKQQQFVSDFSELSEPASAFASSLSSAVEQLKQPNSNQQFWQVQQSLLDGLLIYQELIQKAQSNG
ncbi:hypothetical protein ACJ2A9_12490 [Anaerobacillus sp. MEB173]|uniref:hypothetical protein n=1 Tax=Anaerobacillus sp. MEB173 TaxID=3383345 RepID=UPI003F9163C4